MTRNDEPAWGPWLAKTAAAAIVLLVVTVGLNAVVDARADLGTSSFTPLVADDRRAKVPLIDSMSGPPGTIILGSSRAIALDPSLAMEVGYPDAWNLAVRGGRLDDSLAFRRAVEDQAGAPGNTILALDPHQLAPSPVANLRLLSDPVLGAYIGEPSAWSYVQWGLLSVYDPGHTQDTFRSIWRHATGTIDDPDVFGDRGQFTGTFNEVTNRDAWVTARVRDYSHFSQLESSRMASLRAIITEGLASGNVTIVLTPIHSDFDAGLSTTPYHERVGELLARLTDACQPGLAVHDYSDVAIFGGNEDWFLDGEHYNAEMARAILAGLAAGRGDRCQA